MNMMQVSLVSLSRSLILCMLLCFACVLFANPSHAQAAKLSDLVPCGDDVEVSGDSKTGYTYCNECSACHLQQLAQRVLNFLVAFMTAVAALLFVNAGVLYVTAPTNPGSVSKAHSIFKNTLIGILVILCAYLIIDFALKNILAKEGSVMGYGPWNKVLCTGYSDGCYFVPPMSTIVLESEELTIQNAATQGLTCAAIGSCKTACGADEDPMPQLSGTCQGSTCCKLKSSKLGNSCTSTLGGERGICVATDAKCAVSKPSVNCEGSSYCCISVTEPPVKPKPDGEYDCNNMDSLKEEFGGAGPVNGPGLDNMIACYQSDPEVKKWLSGQTPYTYDKNHPICNYTNGKAICGVTKCSHSGNSCHYGRGTGLGALAVDFNGTNENELCNAITKAQAKCGGTVICNESGHYDHTHVSLSTCPGK